MNAFIDLAFGGDAFDKGAVTHAPLIKGHFLVHCGSMPAEEVVEDDYAFTFRPQPFNCGAPDIASPTRHENCQRALPPIVSNFDLFPLPSRLRRGIDDNRRIQIVDAVLAECGNRATSVFGQLPTNREKYKESHARGTTIEGHKPGRRII
jgi:hypothetical protein